MKRLLFSVLILLFSLSFSFRSVHGAEENVDAKIEQVEEVEQDPAECLGRSGEPSYQTLFRLGMARGIPEFDTRFLHLNLKSHVSPVKITIKDGKLSLV